MPDLEKIVREAVHNKWDPIGIGESALQLVDYDSYVKGLCQILAQNPTLDAIFDYLWMIETTSIGLRGNRNATMQFATWLHRLIDN